MHDPSETNQEMFKENALLKQRIQELEQSVEKFHKAFMTTPDGISLTRIKDGLIIETNVGFKEITGWERDEVLGQTSLDVNFWDNPADRLALVEELKAGRDVLNREFQFRRKDGSVGTGIYSARSIDISGEACLIFVMHDVTDQRQLEETFRASEAKFRSLVEHAFDCIIILDLKGTILFANNAAIQTIEAHDINSVVGRNAMEFIAPESIEDVSRDFAELSIGHDAYLSQYHLVSLRGKRICVESVGKILSYEGNPAVLASMRDITERQKMEEAKRESENLYRTFFEVTGTAILIMEEDMTVSLANEEFYLLTGYDTYERVKWPIFVHEDDRGWMMTHHQQRRVQPENTPRSYEFKLMRKDGIIRNVLAKVDMIPGTKKSICSIMDITKQRETEAALRESEELLRIIIETSTAGIIVMNHEGRILFANPHMGQMLGLDHTLLLGTDYLDYVHPDERQHSRENLEKLCKGSLELLSSKRRFSGKNGADLWCYASCRRLLTKEGRQHLVEVISDITELSQAEEALKYSEERFSKAFHISPAPTIISTIKDGKVVDVNDSFVRMLGYTREEMIGHKAAELSIWADITDRNRVAKKMADQGSLREELLHFRTKTGEIRDVLASVELIALNGNQFLLSIFYDITDQEKLEAHLRQAQKMEAIGTLAGGIAHDFNNILGAMMGYAELSKIRTNDHKIYPYLERVIKACHRSRDLVEQILTFSRQREQEKKPVFVTPIVKEALKLLRSSIPATIEIRQYYNAPQDTVLADPTQIHQILMNLCTNAVHAMRESEGILEVTLGQQELSAGDPTYGPDLKGGTYLQMTVRDTGEGIDPAIKDKIFDPFFTTKAPGEGTGLGLSLVYGIVKGHDGVISMKSEVGIGTVFTIHLPLIDLDEKSAEKENLSIPEGKGCILYVDDEEPLATLGQDMLTSLGYDVTVRFSSRDALEAFRAHPERFDLVITDMTMPNMTGANLAREMLKIRPGLPIILTTGFSQRINEEEAKRIGIREFIMKPISLSNLAQAVKKVIDQENSFTGL